MICSISGYGRDAPPVAALDTVAQAGSGLMALVDGPADSSPLKAGFSYGDLTAAHAAVFAIVAALVERDRSGLGQQIDISMHDALVWLVQLGWPGIGGPSFAVVANGEDGVDREGQAGWTLRVERDAPVPVLEVADAVLGEDAQRRQSLRTIAPGERSGMDATAATTATTDGAWRVLASPHRWRVAPSDIGRFVAMAGADNPRLAAIPQRQALEEI